MTPRPFVPQRATVAPIPTIKTTLSLTSQSASCHPRPCYQSLIQYQGCTFGALSRPQCASKQITTWHLHPIPTDHATWARETRATLTAPCPTSSRAACSQTQGHHLFALQKRLPGRTESRAVGHGGRSRKANSTERIQVGTLFAHSVACNPVALSREVQVLKRPGIGMGAVGFCAATCSN